MAKKMHEYEAASKCHSRDTMRGVVLVIPLGILRQLKVPLSNQTIGIYNFLMSWVID